ncbi:acetylornithine deacetylase/succinyl-diaminopimelate desuccinylase-like protein [Lewinella aquimaris]|uniref:Acetylornithine deacetylase/succinyl-diaminopimelate desuccinylase-like protein n=1 Tax=Neolewinella aquimaris TaxID=1835722 RepID=A0A840EB55_9BACT|nr:M20/M25/M40 family metallo-hydrolase [Neolewinella aquimaris]MBB4080677.1 acetylornithine deacetylase/succinyl-diaminopimelate desuccinylase-like protein [Neolewinella aquimaris]
MRYFSLLLLCVLCSRVPAQTSALYERTLSSLPQFIDFLSLSNDAHIEGQLEPNLQWLEREYSKRGFTTQRLPNEGIDLLLLGFPAEDANAETVLFYGHVDGQPVDPSKWVLAPPFNPVYGTMAVDEAGSIQYENAELTARPDTSDVRLFARSSSDAKAPIMMFLVAWDQMIADGKRPAYHVKFIVDPMEEGSSPDLPGAVETHREALAADHLVILDGPVHAINEPTLVGGARGIATARLTVYGPRLPQHSGHYGNYAPNPALRLAQLLGSMKDQQGRVTIAGYYDGIELDEATREMMAGVPDDPRQIREAIGFSEPDGVGENLQEALQYPSLNIRGMSSGWVGSAARTIIPATAVANLDLRLVKESDGDRLLELVEQHIKNQGFHLIPDGREPTDQERLDYPRLASFSGRSEYGAFRTDLNGPTGTWLQRALTNTFGEPPVLVRTMGGSVPIAPFVNTLDVPAIVLPLVNPDNNQHSPNENIRLSNYFRGVESLYGVLGTGL